MKRVLLIASLFSAVASTALPAAELPEHWFGSDEQSQIQIRYDDVDHLLQQAVLMSGPPSRKKSSASTATVNTRLKNNFNVLTINAGNKLYFEEFHKKPELRAAVTEIRKSLEAIPASIRLNQLNQKEQLAYWLNLYNLVVIDEINQIYPRKNLKDYVLAPDGLLARKTMQIEGVALSLDDIQHAVLKVNFPDQPLVLYGLYQGYIGSPSIRKHAYTGENVMRALKLNAFDFINSNRGTYPDRNSFRVAGFYQRNAGYFPDFQSDLREHIKGFLQDAEQPLLAEAELLVTDINDWTVTDIHGSSRSYGSAAHINRAAILDIRNMPDAASSWIGKVDDVGLYSSDQLQRMRELRINHINRGGVVTVSDLPAEAATTNTTTKP